MAQIRDEGPTRRGLHTMSERMNLGPNGPKVIFRLLLVFAIIVAMLVAVGPFWETEGSGLLFTVLPVLIIGQFVWLAARTLISAKRDLDDGWRD